MEFNRENTRTYLVIQRVIIVSVMVLSTVLIGVSLVNGGYLFRGPVSIQLSAIVFISLIVIMVLASIPSLLIKRIPDDEIDEEVLIWDEEEDDIYEIVNTDGVRSGHF